MHKTENRLLSYVFAYHKAVEEYIVFAYNTKNEYSKRCNVIVALIVLAGELRVL